MFSLNLWSAGLGWKDYNILTDPTKAELEAKIRQAIKEQAGVEVPDDIPFDEFVFDLWKMMPASEREKGELGRRGLNARNHDDPDGYADFFWCCTRRELPRHALYGWIVPTYFAKGRLTEAQFRAYFDRAEGKRYSFIRDHVLKQAAGMKERSVECIGIVIEASRELTKTTSITNYFTAFRIGHEPHRANLLIQVGDDIAKDNSSQVARVIDEYEGWKASFPHIEPDRVKGWGDKGYEVIQTHTWDGENLIPMDPQVWKLKNATRKDPTLLGVGYSSHALLGKHPDGVCCVDDIHDEINTASERELDGVLNIVESVINYAFTSEAWVIYVGTPWVDTDTIGYIKGTGAYISVVMPAYMENRDGTIVYPEEWLEDTQKIFMWEEERGEAWARKKLAQTRKMSEFHRMILLNLKSAGARTYKFKEYPQGDIKWDEWEIVAGVDPTSTFSNATSKGAGVSHFAICYALKTPWNTIVIGDGYLEKSGADIGERELVKFARKHQNFSRASIEDDGAGAIFIGMAKRNQGLTISPHSAGELSHKHGKKARQFDFLNAWLANSTILISDADTPYLNALRKYLQRFPQVHDTSAELDAADAMCYAVLDMPEVWANTVVNVVDAAGARLPARTRARPSLGQYRFLGAR